MIAAISIHMTLPAIRPHNPKMSAELTLRQVAKHVTDEDLYIVIHDNVYNVSEFASEHPLVHGIQEFAVTGRDNRLTIENRSGGVEVLRGVGGEDATEAFEDVGHSDNARELLAELKVGILKRDVMFFPFAYESASFIVARRAQNPMLQDITGWNNANGRTETAGGRGSKDQGNSYGEEGQQPLVRDTSDLGTRVLWSIPDPVARPDGRRMSGTRSM